MSRRETVRFEERLRYLQAPPSQMKVAQFLVSAVLDVPFMTVQAVADAAGVSKATALRTVRQLGFDSFNSLQQYIRRNFFVPLDSPLARASTPLGDDSDTASLVLRFQEREIDNVAHTLSRTEAQRLENVAGKLIKARTVFVYGSRYSYAVAYHLWLRLASLLPGVQLVHGLGGTSADIVSRVGENDYAMLFVHRRIGREKRLFANFLHSRGCRYSVITDAHPSAISKGADEHFITSSTGLGAFNSYTGSLSLAQLVAFVVEQRLGKVVDTLSEAEDAWSRFALFEEV